MNLKEFLDFKKITQAELADRCGVDPVTVWRWVRGDFVPSRKNCLFLIDFSRGKLSFNDLMGGVDGGKARPGSNRKLVECGEKS